MERDDQNLWNFIFSVLFAVFFVALMIILYKVKGSLPTTIPLIDLILIALATFRLTRLFVYDKITRFIRDLFVRIEERHTEQGVAYITRHEYPGGPRRTISELLACPWCFGIWSGLVVTFFYFLTPIAWFPILVMALAGVSTTLQLGANFIGWSAEYKKLEAQSLREGSRPA